MGVIDTMKCLKRRNCRVFDSLAPATFPLRASRLCRSRPATRLYEAPGNLRLAQTPYEFRL